MTLWVGVDDTDSLHGMCTTFLATELVRELTREYDLIGYPRLVRLNPTIPWKTRGNGAVCIRIGQGRGAPFQAGAIEGRPIRAYPSGIPVKAVGTVLRKAARLLEEHAAFDDPTTNPGLVVLERRPPPSLYWRADRDDVPLADVLSLLPGLGAWKGYKSRRGLIGATAATAWRPRDHTYELLAYRPRARWGQPRRLDPDSVHEMDAMFPSTFNNIDPTTRHVALAPHSPCPVFYGIRGDDPLSLPGASRVLRGEAPSRWMIVETNQGTDDHIVPNASTLRPFLSTCADVRVSAEPRTIKGGHVLVPAQGKWPIELAFYEPSKEFRVIARALMPGDRLRVWGSLRDDLRSLNVEKVWVAALASGRLWAGNPPCPACGKSMESMGRGQGFRCRRGHGRLPRGAASRPERPRSARPGWYEPPVYARRHLTKPLKRLGRPLRSETSAASSR